MRYKAIPLAARTTDSVPSGRPPRYSGASSTLDRLRDRIATMPIVLLVPALIVPLLVMRAIGETPTLTVTGTPAPGASIRVSGTDFQSGAKLRLAWDGSSKRMPGPKVSADGTFDVKLIIPSTARPGDHRLDATEGRVVLATATITIAAAPEPTSTPTPDPTATPKPTPEPTPDPTATPSPTKTPAPTPTPEPVPPPSGDYLLMSRARLMSLPMTGTAWSYLKSIADGSLGAPDLCNQDNKHDVRTLAVALAYARTGHAAYYAKVRDAIMSAIGTIQVGCNNAVLSLGRQLGAYVLAADFINLSGADDVAFRTWLTGIRNRDLGGHSRWYTLTGTHNDSNNNWGAFAGASRIAASLYLGDTDDVAAAARVVRGFLGDRSAYAGFRTGLSAEELEWTCTSSAMTYTPVDAACTMSSINLNGAIAGDIYRGGGLQWPANDPGVPYTLEALQGLTLQVELLYQNGYSDAWTWSDSALRRAAGFINRSGLAGGTTWNYSSASYHVPWLLNARYGIDLPTRAAGYGRVFGYTDWLYGS